MSTLEGKRILSLELSFLTTFIYTTCCSSFELYYLLGYSHVGLSQCFLLLAALFIPCLFFFLWCLLELCFMPQNFSLHFLFRRDFLFYFLFFRLIFFFNFCLLSWTLFGWHLHCSGRTTTAAGGPTLITFSSGRQRG